MPIKNESLLFGLLTPRGARDKLVHIQILTRQELMLSFLLQALVHMEFKEDHKQYVNQVTHAGEEKEKCSTRIKGRDYVQRAVWYELLN